MVKRANIVGGLIVEGRLDGDHKWDQLDDMDECVTVMAHRHRLELRAGFTGGSVQMFLPTGSEPLGRIAYLFVSLKRSMHDTKLAMRIDQIDQTDHIDRASEPLAVKRAYGWAEWDFTDDLDGWFRFAWCGQSNKSPADCLCVQGHVGGFQTALIRSAGRYSGVVAPV